MTGLPPTINPNTGSPAGEWATNTTSALNPTTTTTNVETDGTNSNSMNPTTAQLFAQQQIRPATGAAAEPASSTSTPGYELPGAFPRDNDGQSVPGFNWGTQSTGTYPSVFYLISGSSHWGTLHSPINDNNYKDNRRDRERAAADSAFTGGGRCAAF